VRQDAIRLAGDAHIGIDGEAPKVGESGLAVAEEAASLGRVDAELAGEAAAELRLSAGLERWHRPTRRGRAEPATGGGGRPDVSSFFVASRDRSCKD
jgi:hypothetical protein